MDKEHQEIHKKLIPTKLIIIIMVQCNILFTTQQNTNMPYNLLAFLAVNNARNNG